MTPNLKFQNPITSDYQIHQCEPFGNQVTYFFFDLSELEVIEIDLEQNSKKLKK